MNSLYVRKVKSHALPEFIEGLLRPRPSPLYSEGIDVEAQMKRHFAPSYFITHVGQHINFTSPQQT